MSKTNKFIEKIKLGDFRTIAQAITIVENNLEGSEELLINLKANRCLFTYQFQAKHLFVFWSIE